MLVLPIVNRDRILNVEIKLKDLEKIDNSDLMLPNNIYTPNGDFNSSNYNKKGLDSYYVTEFLRNSYAISKIKKDFYITTKEEGNSTNYNTYEVSFPKLTVNKQLDSLYGEALLDVKNSVPDSIKGHYIDLSKYGITSAITEEKLEKLRNIMKSSENCTRRIEEEGLTDLVLTLEFLKLFEFKVIPKTSIKLDDFSKVALPINSLNTKDSKSIRNYYTMAVNNKECYSYLSKLYNILYDDSYDLIKSSKKMVKKAA